MRPLQFVLPAVLLASLALPSIGAHADQPTAKPATNRRVTLYNDGKVTGVLMLYGTNSTARIVVKGAKSTFVNKKQTESSVHITGDVTLSISRETPSKSTITLTADEVLIETLSDQPLPTDF